MVAFGRIVENALQERVTVYVGKREESKPRYTLDQVLDPAFRLPRPRPDGSPADHAQNAAAHQQLLNLSRQARSNVKAFKYVGPLN